MDFLTQTLFRYHNLFILQYNIVAVAVAVAVDLMITTQKQLPRQEIRMWLAEIRRQMFSLCLGKKRQK